MTEPSIDIVTLADRPDLVALVAEWVWQAFDRLDSLTLEETARAVATSTARVGPPQTFVLLRLGKPVGTASLLADDGLGRLELTPWLASVFVVPEARGRGTASRLVHAVEAAAAAAGIGTLWLYTHEAERLYAGLGWRGVETFERGERQATLMRRDLRPEGQDLMDGPA